MLANTYTNVRHVAMKATKSSQHESRRNLILIGAGLNNALIAWFVKRRNPALKITVLEKSRSMDELRTWSFHENDVEFLEELKPLVYCGWPGHEVKFPKYSRKFQSEYFCVKPKQLQKELAGILMSELKFLSEVINIDTHQVTLKSGETFEADCVIDGRGAQRMTSVAYQKFLGLTLRFKKPHGLSYPILMDANVPQLDGYRFFYVLPFSSDQLLIEDTRYSSKSEIDLQKYEQDILTYAEKHFGPIEEICERESGVLPLPMDSDFQSTLSEGTKVPLSGYAGGFFHPVTGYSLPDGVRIADRISKLSRLTTEGVKEVLDRYTDERSSRTKFFCMLNRMMFLAAPETERYKVFEYFYKGSDRLIENFYSGNLTYSDRLLFFKGKPPVAVWPALKAIAKPVRTSGVAHGT